MRRINIQIRIRVYEIGLPIEDGIYEIDLPIEDGIYKIDLPLVCQNLWNRLTDLHFYYTQSYPSRN